jgi:trimeric autotransporter adhesin
MSKRFLVLYFSIFIATGLYSQNVGIGTTTPTARLHVKDSSVLFSGSFGVLVPSGNPPASGPGKRLMWYADKAAFRVGTVTSTYWDKDSIGNYSIALGYDTKALGQASISIGAFSSARGAQSLALGNYCNSEGDLSTSLGYGASAQGSVSMAVGYGVIARSYESTALGTYNDFIPGSSTNNFVSTDPLLIVGNGFADNIRSNAMMILKNGNVGLGTNTPFQKLDISGNVCVNNNTIYLRDGNDFYHGLRYNATVDGPYLFGFLGGALGSTNGPYAVRWDWAGHVAIRSDLAVDTAAMNNGDIYNSLRFGGWSGEGIGSKRTAGGNQNGLDFYTGVVNRMSITNGGNVGIGTTNPLQKLDINGNVSLNDNTIYLRAGNDPNHGLRFSNDVNGPYLFGYIGGALGTSGAPSGNIFRNSLTWDISGNVAVRGSIGVDTAALNNGNLNNALLFGGWGGEGIGSKKTAGGNQNGLDFYTAFNNRMAITNGGNVGIGTTTPASKLEVNGETKTASLKVGNNGTSLLAVQKGTFTIGNSAGASKTVTFNFPNAFSSIPVLVATVRNDAGFNVGDTFVASIRSISTTSVTFNIQRVDVAGGWTQILLLNWIAME